MKYFISILFIVFLWQNLTEAQTPTYVGLPGPANVLVVYKAKENPQDTLGMISDSVKNYYKDSRNIPSENIIFPGLRFPDTTITIDGVSHNVSLAPVCVKKSIAVFVCALGATVLPHRCSLILVFM